MVSGTGCHEGVGALNVNYSFDPTGVRDEQGHRVKGAVVRKCNDMTLDDEDKLILMFVYYFKTVLRLI